MNTATCIKAPLPDFEGFAALYAVNPPIKGHSFVILSSVANLVACEVMMFPADADGKVLDWQELDGLPGFVSHEAFLFGKGYQLVINIPQTTPPIETR